MLEHPHNPRDYPYADKVIVRLFTVLKKRHLP